MYFYSINWLVVKYIKKVDDLNLKANEHIKWTSGPWSHLTENENIKVSWQLVHRPAQLHMKTLKNA